MAATRATIFRVGLAAWGLQPGAAYGVRLLTQYLPKEVWVVGLIAVDDDGAIQELLAPGSIQPEEQASYDACIRYARLAVRGEWESDAPYKGLIA